MTKMNGNVNWMKLAYLLLKKQFVNLRASFCEFASTLKFSLPFLNVHTRYLSLMYTMYGNASLSPH